MSKRIRRALSIRQPYAELILRGEKPIEYRSRPTHIRERVYIYAAKGQDKEDRAAFADLDVEPGDLPTGVLVGTVEIVDCVKRRIKGKIWYEWHLARPKRLKRLLKPENRPQPAWFYPFNEA